MNEHTYNAPTISAGTIARTACLLLALTNQVLSALGKPVLPIESQTVEQLVTAGITTVAALVAWWKNNSFTPEAIEADAFMARMKKRMNHGIEIFFPLFLNRKAERSDTGIIHKARASLTVVATSRASLP